MANQSDIVSHLNILLSNKLNALNQHFIHAKIYKNLELNKLAEHEYNESLEQMRLADQITDRILTLKGQPDCKSTAKLSLGKDTKDILKSVLKNEEKNVKLTKSALATSEKANEDEKKKAATEKEAKVTEEINAAENKGNAAELSNTAEKANTVDNGNTVKSEATTEKANAEDDGKSGNTSEKTNTEDNNSTTNSDNTAEKTSTEDKGNTAKVTTPPVKNITPEQPDPTITLIQKCLDNEEKQIIWIKAQLDQIEEIGIEEYKKKMGSQRQPHHQQQHRQKHAHKETSAS